MENSFSGISKYLRRAFLFIGAALIFAGCTSTSHNQQIVFPRTLPPVAQEPPVATTVPAPAPVPAPALQAPRPSSPTAASLKLTNRGRSLLQEGNADDAITVLEQSLGLDPKNGQSYYWLAEAWMEKRNPLQAAECNRLADLYLRKDPAWSSYVENQRRRIQQAN